MHYPPTMDKPPVNQDETTMGLQVEAETKGSQSKGNPTRCDQQKIENRIEAIMSITTEETIPSKFVKSYGPSGGNAKRNHEYSCGLNKERVKNGDFSEERLESLSTKLRKSYQECQDSRKRIRVISFDEAIKRNNKDKTTRGLQVEAEIKGSESKGNPNRRDQQKIEDRIEAIMSITTEETTPSKFVKSYCPSDGNAKRNHEYSCGLNQKRVKNGDFSEEKLESLSAKLRKRYQECQGSRKRVITFDEAIKRNNRVRI